MPLNRAKTARLVRDHVNIDPGDGVDWHQWVTTNRWVKANALGVSSPRMYEANWLEVVCNNPDCPGTAWVDVLYVVSGDFPARAPDA